MTAQDAIGYLDFPCEPCDHNPDHEAATWLLTVAKGSTERTFYLCDDCAGNIRRQTPPLGSTITLQRIGGWE